MLQNNSWNQNDSITTISTNGLSYGNCTFYNTMETSVSYKYSTTYTPIDNNIISNVSFYDLIETDIIKETLTLKAIPSTNLISLVEERIEEHILDNYDKQELKESSHYIYQIVQEKAYEFASDALKEAEEEWIIPSETDELIEGILNEIDFDSIYNLIDNILDEPITMEDKLAEVGMSISDFL